MRLRVTCPDCGYVEEVDIGKTKEILLRIPIDEANKLRYALDHVYLTGSERIDAVLNTLNEVLKEEMKSGFENQSAPAAATDAAQAQEE